MFKRWLWYCCAALGILGSAPYDASAAHAIMVYGDSLSAGYGLPREQSWPALLAQRLKQSAPDYTVVNASISGETSAGGERRISHALARHKPALVILALGANDGLRGHSLDSLRANLETMITASRKANARVLLVGMRIPPNYGGDYTRQFAGVYATLAQKHQLPFAPFLLDGFAGDRELFQGDGLHPNTKAQAMMLETVWKVLQPMVVRSP
jgi:acyl-CoA thioesterase-1